jgi:glycerophosphoryl diester phosphodiesterase
LNALVIGHRGARAVAPENTLAGLRRGLADGADGLEFDVRALADGHAALLHDATVDRTTDGAGPLAGYDRAAVAKLDAGARFAAAFRGERVPLLADVLDEFLGRTSLALEMKEVLPDAVLDAIGRAVAARPGATLRMASFQPDAVDRARERLPRVPRALILPAGDAPPSAATVRALSLSGLFAPDPDVTAAYARDVRALDLALWVYTVNDPGRARDLGALGAGAIITDDPATIRSGIRGG